MTDNKTSIHLTWDANGRVNHRVSGFRMSKPKDNVALWVVAPSAPFFVANQLGVLRPSHGLILCSQVLHIAFQDDFILSPINTTLKDARLDFIYTQGGVAVQFFPSHALIHNSDSLEEGTRQLVANNFYSVLNDLEDYYQIGVKTSAVAVVGLYHKLLEDGISASAIGPGKDQWSIGFSRWSAQILHVISSQYYVPDLGQVDWAKKQKKFLSEKAKELLLSQNAISRKLGTR